MAWKSSFRTTFLPTVPTSAAGISHVVADVKTPGVEKWKHLKRGEKQWQATPKNLPRMQRTRAIPVAWLNYGLCPDRPKGWIPIIIIIIIITTLSIAGRFSLYKRLSELWLLHNPDPHVKQQEILLVPCQYILSLMSFIINIIWISGYFSNNINMWNKNHFHRPNANHSVVQKKYILCWHKNFQQFTTRCDNHQEWQGTI